MSGKISVPAALTHAHHGKEAAIRRILGIWEIGSLSKKSLLTVKDPAPCIRDTGEQLTLLYAPEQMAPLRFARANGRALTA